MRRRVPGFHRNEDLEKDGRRRIRDGGDGEDGADRLSDLDDLLPRVFGDHAHRLLVLDIEVDEPGGDDILDDLVLPPAQFRLFAGELGQPDTVGKSRLKNRFDDPVRLLLPEAPERYRGGDGLVHDPLDVEPVRREFIFHGGSPSGIQSS